MGWHTGNSKVMYTAYTNTRSSNTPAEPDEIDENINPFTGMEIASDVELSDSNSDEEDSRATDSDNTHRPDVDSIMKCTLVHDILLDSAANSEDEDVDIKDESIDYEAEDSGSEDEDADTAKEDELDIRSREDRDGRPAGFKYGFDGIELGFVPPPPTCKTEDR